MTIGNYPQSSNDEVKQEDNQPSTKKIDEQRSTTIASQRNNLLTTC